MSQKNTANTAHVEGQSFIYAQRRAQIRARVLDILEKCDPGKADKVDMVLDKFEGRERELFEKLRETYSDHKDYPKQSGNVDDTEIDKILKEYEEEDQEDDGKAAEAEAAKKLAALKLKEGEEKKAASTKAKADAAAKAKQEKVKKEEEKAKKQREEAEAKKKKEEAEAKKKKEEEAAAAKKKKEAAERKAAIDSGDKVDWKEPDATPAVIKTCMWHDCRRMRKMKKEEKDDKKPGLKLIPEYGMFFCALHAREQPRADGLLPKVVAWEYARPGATMVVQWIIQMLVVPDGSKFGKELPSQTEPLMTTTKIRFSDLADLHKKCVKHYKKEKWEEDLKVFPKFASKKVVASASKLWSSNEVYTDEFLNKRKEELQTWLDEFLAAPKIENMSEVWSTFGLANTDNNKLAIKA